MIFNLKILTNRIKSFIMKHIYIWNLYLMKKSRTIDGFYYSILKDYSYRNAFGKMKPFFYQTHPSLNINGARPTLVRIKNYEILQYVNNSSVVLDIGCNTGFFSLYLSQFVERIDAVEFDKSLHSIAMKTKLFLDVNNVNFYNQDIKKFNPNTKYDVVMSFSVHQWVGIPIEDYLDFVQNFKKEDGILFIESHGNDDRTNLFNAIEKSNLTIISKGITDDYAGILRDFYILK